MGHLTQTWLASSEDPAAKVTGRYWHHRQTQTPASEALDREFQDHLLGRLVEMTGVTLS